MTERLVELPAGDKSIWLNPRHVVAVSSDPDNAKETLVEMSNDDEAWWVSLPAAEVVARLTGGEL